MKFSFHQVFFVCIMTASMSSSLSSEYSKIFSTILRRCPNLDDIRHPLSGQTIRLHYRDRDKTRIVLEVLQGTEWKFVAGEEWDTVDADVACKQLGYNKGHRSTNVSDSTTLYHPFATTIAMTKVNCRGSERSLQECQSEPPGRRGVLKPVVLSCRQDKGCPSGWHSGFNKCYRPMTRPSSNEKQAAKLCSRMGANLLTIGSREENHFVSDILTQDYKYEGNSEAWYTGGKLRRGRWIWSQPSARVSRGVRQRRRTRMRKRPIDKTVQMWFPGWPEHRNYSAEPRARRRCLTLSNTFKDWRGCEKRVEYFFWKSDRCSKKKNYICERKLQATDNSFSISLSDETRPGAGVVLVEKDGGVGHICADDDWDDQDASVVCRTLGYVRGKADFSQISSVPRISKLKCSGREQSLHDCPHRLSEHEACKNDMFARVLCSSSDTNVSKWEQSIVSSTTTKAAITSKTTKVMATTTEAARRWSLDPTAQCGRRPTLSRFRQFRWEHRRVEPTNPTSWLWKISQGQEWPPGYFPWQAVLRDGNGDFKCGGTIIGEYWVLTAAHCLSYITLWEISIGVGAHFKNTRYPNYSDEDRFKVEKIIVHHAFSGTVNDIALLKVKAKGGRGIVFNDYVQPACLPTEITPYTAGTSCLVSGWGYDGVRSYTSEELLGAEVSLINWKECTTAYARLGKSLTPGMICAGDMRGGPDTCEGDSGGPLVCPIDGSYTLHGITSWGIECGKPGQPGVYANVQAFIPWIRRHTSLHGHENPTTPRSYYYI